MTDCKHNLEDILPRLSNPPADYRGTPFWAWNARLTPDEIRAQIRVFHEMGLGGFFMHSRTGLATPYLGPEWFDCVRAAVDEAKKLGMQPWMYDEDRWPSGAAGGIVTRNPRYRFRRLEFEAVSAAAAPKAARRRHTLAWFALEIAKPGSGLGERKLLAMAQPKDYWNNPPTLLGYRRLASPTEPLADGEVLARFFECVSDPSTWYNGGTYVDTLNPAAIRAFVKTTHEAYLRELGDDFGKAVPGCFTDEPNFAWRPWTGAFARAFYKQHGYDVLDHLPELFAWVVDFGFSRVRHDYLETATTLFVKAFSKTIGQWCGRHGLLFTGHALEEDGLARQSNCVGSAMRFYEFQQAPGIDQLMERSAIYPTAKQCSSVAHQLGRPYRLVEAYGCTGWDFPLEGHKAIGDWLVALGINHRCQHLAWYSMAAQAKRDYPASISRQSPWFRKYKAVEDYFARIGETLGAGEEEIPLLVVHPVESMWGFHLPKQTPRPETQPFDDAFLTLTNRLLAEHLDFDYGDEDHLARWARTSGRRLRVAKATYDAVLVPELATIRRTTLELLRAFAAKGGRVFTLGRAPALVDAQPSDDAAEVFAAFTPVTMETLSETLSPAARRVSIAEDGRECEAILYQERKCRNGFVLFAVNTSMPVPTEVSGLSIPMVRDRNIAYPRAVIRLKAPKSAGDVYELDLETGAIRSVPYRRQGGMYVIDAPFGRLQSRMFLVAKNLPCVAATSAPAATAADVAIPSTGLAYALDDDNALVLDAARWSIDDGEMRPETRALDIDRALRAELGAEPRKGNMTQPWCSAQKTPARRIALRLEYRFRCEGVANTPIALAIERPEGYRIALNGVELPNESATWWVDPCLSRIAIPAGAVREGENTLVLEGLFDETLPGLEAMFLLGAFGVSEDGGTLLPLPKTLDVGDICPQGLPNYSGNVTYRFRADVPASGAVRIAAGDWRGSAVGFRVNGGAEVFRPFPPYEAVFADGLRRDGTDEFEVTVYGHRRNVFGPFYLKGGEKWPRWSGPDQLGATDEPTRALVPFGLGAK